jgi:hypothetical protein
VGKKADGSWLDELEKALRAEIDRLTEKGARSVGQRELEDQLARMRVNRAHTPCEVPFDLARVPALRYMW